jgi:uncharacterized Zn-finger protein
MDSLQEAIDAKQRAVKLPSFTQIVNELGLSNVSSPPKQMRSSIDAYEAFSAKHAAPFIAMTPPLDAYQSKENLEYTANFNFRRSSTPSIAFHRRGSSTGHEILSYTTITKPTSGKAFRCDTCDATFDRKHNLTRHIRTIHTHYRPHVCRFCPAAFARTDALKRHMSYKHNMDTSLPTIRNNSI